MTDQQSLLSSSPIPSGLPGPQFQSRPGWGGRLNQWWRTNGRLALFQLILLLALGVIARSVWISNTELGSKTPTPNVSPDVQVSVHAGDNLTRVATNALNLYLSETTTPLDTIQRLFAITTLVQAHSDASLDDGTTVTFLKTEFATLVERARALTPSQRAAWAKYLK